MSAEFYTIKQTAVKASALRQARLLLSLPTGSWPETAEAEDQLSEMIPPPLTIADLLEFAARHTAKVHQSRMDWLTQLGREYPAKTAGEIYPALAAEG